MKIKFDFKFKAVTISIFAALSVCIKALLIVLICHGGRGEQLISADFEYASFACDALLALTVFAVVQSKLCRIWAKIASAAACVVLYMIVLMSTNFFVTVLASRIYANEAVSFIDVAADAMKTYFQTGHPKYHVVAAVLALACTGVIAFDMFRTNRALPFVKSAKSNAVTQESGGESEE